MYTEKIIDPSGAGDYLNINLALADLASVTGVIVLTCRRGRCDSTGSPTATYIHALACDTLIIRAAPGAESNGSISQPLQHTAYLCKAIVFIPTAVSSLKRFFLINMRGHYGYPDSATYGMFQVLNSGNDTDLFCAVLGCTWNMTTFNSDSAIGVRAWSAGTCTFIASDNFIYADEDFSELDSYGYIEVFCTGGTVNAFIYNNVGVSVSARHIIGGVYLETSTGGTINADIRNNAIFNCTAPDTLCFWSDDSQGGTLNITGDFNISDDNSALSSIGGSGALPNTPASSVLAFPTLSSEQLPDSPGLLGGQAITQIDPCYRRPNPLGWNIGCSPAAYSYPTPAEILWNLPEIIDGKSPAEALKILAAILAGKISGAGTGTETFKGLDGLTDRVEVVADNTGNRSSVTYL